MPELFQDARRRTTPAPARPQDTVCRSATPPWPTDQGWRPPQVWTAHHPSAAVPDHAAPCVPVAIPRSITHPIAGDLAVKAQYAALCPCLSHKARYFSCQVSMFVTYICGHGTRDLFCLLKIYFAYFARGRASHKTSDCDIRFEFRGVRCGLPTSM